MYGLFHYSYDYHTFKELIVVSKSQQQLRDYYEANKNKIGYGLSEPLLEGRNFMLQACRQETPHFRIKSVKVI